MEVDYGFKKDFERHLEALKVKYGEDFEILNGVHSSQLNQSNFISNFSDKDKALAEVTIDNNASTSNKDIASLMNEKGKPIDKLYAANKIFYELKKKYGLATARQWLEEEWIGAFYLHDFPSATYKPYCFAYDLGRLAREGLFFLPTSYNNQGPKHLTTFVDDLIEYISFMCNRSSGAVGIPNVIVWMFYFWKHDVANNYYMVSPDYYFRQSCEKLIYRLNQPFMRIDQSAFVNVSIFDRYYYEALFGGLEFPDGSYAIDYVDEFIEAQKIFMEVVSEIREQNMFTYPVLTYSLLKRDDITEEEALEMLRTKKYNVFKDAEFARWCSDFNCKWNDSNFFVHSDVTTLSNCCRLLSDTSKLSGFINSVGGTALSVGSIKVNTINLMHIVYELLEEDNLTEKKYLSMLKKRTTLCCKVLDRVRHIIKRNVEKGLLPNYCEGGVEMDKQYCTIGILGLYEVMEKFGYIRVDEFGNKFYTDDGMEFSKKIFEVINNVKDNFTDEYSFNIESVPAERAAVNLCAKDNTLFNVNDKFIYSNQWIPLTETCTINEKIRTAAVLDNLCSGGAIAHINIENNFENTDMAWEMLNYIALKGVIYFCFNTRINVCKNRHGFVGTDICPVCGEPVFDTYQRVVGFLTPSKSYSPERQKEFSAREWYETAKIYGESSVMQD
jgi:ribonucleoside-triphosphate reductase